MDFSSLLVETYKVVLVVVGFILYYLHHRETANSMKG